MSSPFQDIESLYRRIQAEVKNEDALSQALLSIYHDLVLKVSDSSQLQFNTLFARVSFIATKFHFSKAWTFAFQIPRREIRQRQLSNSQLIPVLIACIDYLLAIGHSADKNEVAEQIQPPGLPKLPFSRKAGRYKKASARVIATEWNPSDKTLLILDDDEPGKVCTLHYAVPGVNDIFSDAVELALQEIGLPLVLSLVEIDCVEEQDYVPGYIIILPDLLIDVTTIAEYLDHAHDPEAINLLPQFLPSKSSTTLLIGKMANYFLDELMQDSQLSFNTLFASSFKLFPLEFIRLSDEEVKSLMKQMLIHFTTIQQVIVKRLPALGIDQRKGVIEPSYFSPAFGIKGRLDLYFQHEEEKTASIIELKSGRPFKPNSYGLSSSHYHQTLLYELLIQAVHGPNHYRSNFILYSALEENPLRYAVSVGSIQKETIHNRNQLVLLQFRLNQLGKPNSRDILAEINPERHEGLKGFLKSNVIEFHAVYSRLKDHEKNYLRVFSAFVGREHTLARIGNESEDGSGGLASLWLDPLSAKEKGYQILQGLIVQEIIKKDQQTTICFQRTDLTNPLANFRAGDIAVMYPGGHGETTDPTRYQLHRANILAIDASTITIRLRNNQINTSQIESTPLWNLEHDLLDSSFRSLYQSLWMLMKADEGRRKLLLGLIPPVVTDDHEEIPVPDTLTVAQQKIFRDGIQARMLYLLWGPPGTGKTSVILKHWVEHYYSSSRKRILLLAYTNRAVDEICAALHNSPHGLEDHYLRIGSRAATQESFRHRLFDQVIQSMSKRAQIKSLLDQTRIFVGTVSSLQGKPELFSLIKFDVMIIDEASQLLEPAIAGLLTQTEKTILIGDHMQLPAVSLQGAGKNQLIKSGWAESIGLTELSMSYFERMYRLYQSRGWEHLIGTLNEQGRMQAEIMDYVNRVVYFNQLRCVYPEHQNRKLNSFFSGHQDPILTSGLIYIPSRARLLETYVKTNQEEAELVLQLLQQWKALMAEHHLSWTIGVITPFRAQIASILYLAHQQRFDLSDITVDTVERYQGGARDIIIMSAACNHKRSLDRMSSINQEGIDRKLNVAITRARQQFILIGVEEVLKGSPAYAEFMKAAYKPEKNFSVYQPEA